MDEMLIKLEDSTNVVNELKTSQKLQTKTNQTRKQNQTPIHKINIKLPNARSSAVQRTKIKPPSEQAPDHKRIKIAPALERFPAMPESDKQRYNIRTILLCSNATPIRTHSVGNGYTCSFCKGHFLKAVDLKTHTIQDHDDETKKTFVQKIKMFKLVVNLDITSLTCNICSLAIDTLKLLIDHLNNIHQKGIHTDIKSHIACFKLDNELFKCHVCSTEYHSFKCLRVHMTKHSTNFICDECGTGFINRNQLNSHSEMHIVGAHKCETCDKIFNSSIKLKQHKRQTHTGILMHKCHQCDKRFKTKCLKKKHINEIHGVVFADLQCDACDRTFKNIDGLRNHKKRDHLMERRFKCEICDYRFFSPGMLKNHMVKHTGLRDFKCDMCSKSYTRRTALVEHIRSHTGDRRFKCTYCDMTFLQKCSLKGHLRSRHDAELQ